MKSFRLMLVATLGLGIFAASALAEGWPAKPVRAIVPVGAGGTTDIIPRIVLEQLSRQLSQPIVVENRPGAGTTIGAAAVARSNPDGYTLLVNGSSHTIAPALYSKLSYHPSRDFVSVAPIGITPSVLVVPPGGSLKTVATLIAAAKKRQGALNFSSVGIGTATHLSAERFLASAGLQAVHVPFKGGPEAMTEVIAGRIDFFFGPVALVLPQIRQGKLIALAVNGAARSDALPDVPTISEAGLSDAEYPLWLGLFLPAKTSRDIVEKLNRETQKALQTSELRGKFADLGFRPMTMSVVEFSAFIEKDIALNSALVKGIGLKPE